MRQTLVSWLVEVHTKFGLLSETLYIAVNMIDRYCNVRHVPRSEYQLLGITALFTAAKYEEILVPKLEEFVDISANTYTAQQLLYQEYHLLSALNFDLNIPTMYRFAERYANIASVDKRTLYLANYLCELSLVESRMLKWSPSRIASAAIYLSLKM